MMPNTNFSLLWLCFFLVGVDEFLRGFDEVVGVPESVKHTDQFSGVADAKRTADFEAEGVHLALFPIPGGRHPSTVFQDMDDRRLACTLAPHVSTFVYAPPVVTGEAVQRPKLAELLVQPVVDVLKAVAEQPLTVAAMFFEGCHLVGASAAVPSTITARVPTRITRTGVGG